MTFLTAFLPGIFLALTGFALGYFIKYQDRREEASYKASLRAENQELQSRLTLTRSDYEKLQAKTEQQQNQLETLQQLCDDWAASRKQSDHERLEIEKVAAEAKEQYDSVFAQLQTEKQQRISLEDANHRLVQQQIEKLAKLESEWRNRQAKIESSLRQRQLKSDDQTHQEYQSQIESLHEQLSSFESLQSQHTSLQQTHENTISQLEKITVQRDELLETESSAILQIGSLQKRINNQEHTIGQLREKKNDVLEKLQNELASRTRLESDFDQQKTELETQIVELQTKLENQAQSVSKRFEQQATDHSDELQSHLDTIEQLTAQRDERNAALVQTQNSLDHTKADLESAKIRTADLTAKIEDLKTTCLRISELEALVQRRDQDDQQAIEELRNVREQFAQTYQQQQDLKRELERVNGDLTQSQSQLQQHQAELESLRQERAQDKETIATLRRQRADALEDLKKQQAVVHDNVISFTEAMALRHRQSTHFDQEYEGYTVDDSMRGQVYTEPPSFHDDLKRISGIADVLEARLNDHGVYTFKQIMQWNQKNIDEFSRLLTAIGRIERDDWVAQARQLYDQKQNAERSAAA